MYEYLLRTKKYDLNYQNPNAEGQTCMHFICAISQQDYKQIRRRECSEVTEGEYEAMMGKLIGMLLEHGADPEIENDRG